MTAQQEMLEAIVSDSARVVAAIMIPGPEPAVHYSILARHRREWPALWKALDRLAGDFLPVKDDA